MNRIKQSIAMIDAITRRLDETPEERAERLEEARKEDREYLEECKSDKDDWDMKQGNYL